MNVSAHAAAGGLYSFKSWYRADWRRSAGAW